MATPFVFLNIESQLLNTQQIQILIIICAKECKPGAIKMVEEER